MLCNDAAMGPLRSMTGAILLKAKKSDIPKINVTHFKSSLKNVRASCAPSAILHYHKWDEQFGSKLFLTMDVLPENMKQKPLLSVEEEKRKKQQEEEAKERELLEAQNPKKKQEEPKKEPEKLQKVEVPKVEPQNTETQKPEKQQNPDKKKKLLSLNAEPPKKGSRRKSENIYSKTKSKKKGKGTKYFDDGSIRKPKPNTDFGTGSLGGKRPKVLNPKTIKISNNSTPPATKTKLKSQRSDSPKSHSNSGRSSGHVSSPSLPDTFTDKKKLLKRSSKPSSGKKGKGKK